MDKDSSCQECLYPCKTCSGGDLSNCDGNNKCFRFKKQYSFKIKYFFNLECETTLNRGSHPTCACINNYYDDGAECTSC